MITCVAFPVILLFVRILRKCAMPDYAGAACSAGGCVRLMEPEAVFAAL